MERFVMLMVVIVAVSFLRVLWRDRAAIAERWNRPVSTVQPQQSQDVMSNGAADLLPVLVIVTMLHARSETKRAEEARNAQQNERDISANRRAEIKKMLDRERRLLPPDQWTNKTQFRAIIGGNTTRAGELYDDLHRELDAVEREQLNAKAKRQELQPA